MTAFLFFGQNPCECIYVYIHIAYSGYILYLKVEGLVAQSCPTLWNPPGSSIHGILQARIVEWVATPSAGELPDPSFEPGSPAL